MKLKSTNKRDPIGQAIQDYSLQNDAEDIVVQSDILDDDIIPIEYLFRTYKDFPILEKKAMALCKGKILDIGAGAGAHSKYLNDKGFDIATIESSPLAYEYLIKSLPKNRHFLGNVEEFENEKFDTILLLMNGIGIAKSKAKTVDFLNKLKSLLFPGGQILCDSTDVKYLFEDEDGSLWVDLSNAYYGDFKFRMKYKNQIGDWFNWVYLDLKSFQECAEKSELNLTLCAQEGPSFLVQLTHK